MLLSSIRAQAKCMLQLKRQEDFNNIKKTFPDINWQTFEAEEQKPKEKEKEQSKKIGDLMHGMSVPELISVSETLLGQTEDESQRQLCLQLLARANRLLSSQQEPEN